MTIARAFTDSFAGIAPGSIADFVAAQLLGAALGAGQVVLLFPHDPTPAKPLTPAELPTIARTAS